MIILWSNWMISGTLGGLLIVITYHYFIRKMNMTKVGALFITSILLSTIILSAYMLIKKYGYNSYTLTCVCLIYFLLIITFHDIKERIIPFKWIIFGSLVGSTLLINNPNLKIIEGCLGTIGVGSFLLIICKITKESLGTGDAYVFALISLLIGWKMAGTIFMLALLLSGIIGIVLYAFKKVNRKTTVPFMPFVMVVTLLIIWT